MTDDGVGCELCGTPTVHKVGESTSGVEEWRCTTCGDFKRWCAGCNQGWIRRFRIRGTDTALYSCDECEAAWCSLAEIQGRESDRRSVLRRLGAAEDWGKLEMVRERWDVPR